MSERRSDRFIQALHQLEQQGDTRPLVEMFAPDAQLGNSAAAEGSNKGDVEKFWNRYRQTFRDIHSEFRNIIEADQRAALEWRSRGTTAAGRTFEYDGVTVLEFSNGLVSRFFAYFDPAALADSVLERPAA